jgi:tetratricopeptide (TPR) repeat protein
MDRWAYTRVRLALAGAAIIGVFGMAALGTAAYRSPTPVERFTARFAFYGARLDRDPADFLAMNQLADTYTARARLLGDEADYTRAEEMLRRSLSVNPSRYNLSARTRLASALLARHRFREAQAMAETVLVYKPGDRAAMAVVGDALFETGDPAGAAAWFRDLADLAPGVASFSRMAKLAAAQGDAKAARYWFSRTREAADEESGEPAAWVRVMMAELSIRTGDHDAARAYGREALRIVPDYYLAYEHLAEVEEREGNHAAARPLLQKAIGIARHPEFLLRLAGVEERLGNLPAARRLREEARARLEASVAAGDPEHLRALALCLLDLGVDAPRALWLAEQDTRLRGGYQTDAVMARALAANGALQRACVYMNRALAGRPLDPDLYLTAAALFDAYGDPAAGAAARRAGARINPRLK